jgi:hypothetical protein
MKSEREKVKEEDARLLKEIREYARRNKIPLKLIAKHTGYTEVHISLVLSGKTRASKGCKREILTFLARYALENYKELENILRGTPWKESILSLF